MKFAKENPDFSYASFLISAHFRFWKHPGLLAPTSSPTLQDRWSEHRVPIRDLLSTDNVTGWPRNKLGTMSMFFWVLPCLWTHALRIRTWRKQATAITKYTHVTVIGRCHHVPDSHTLPCPWRYKECCQDRSPSQATPGSTHIVAIPSERQRHHHVWPLSEDPRARA